MDLEARVAQLERQIAQIARQTQQSVSFARHTTEPTDTGPVQTTQAQFDALSLREMPVLFHFGFTSVMPIDGDNVVVHLDGARSKGVIVATGHQQYRLRSQKTGEVALYDMWGRTVRLTKDGIVIEAGDVPMTIIGDLHVTGNVMAAAGTDHWVTLLGHGHSPTEPVPVPRR